MLKKTINRYLADKRGNFSIMAALAFPVMFGGVAMSIDVMNNLRIRTELQNSTDTAVLYATRYYQINKASPSNADAKKYLEANFNGPLQNVKLVYNAAKSEMTLTADSPLTPYMMNYFGNFNVVVKSESRATLGISGILEFALALDTTDSMKFDGRMAGLKVAANSFIKLLFDKKDMGANIKGAIVPFAQYVNVGVSRRNEPWMDVPADIDNRVTTMVDVTKWKSKPGTWHKITPAGYWTAAKPAVAPSCWLTDGYKQCDNGKPAEPSKWVLPDPYWDWDWESYVVKEAKTTGSYFTWKGCVSSRTSPDNVKDPFNGKQFPGILDVECTSELQPLTDQRSVLVNKINALKPLEATYVPEGVMWGMRTLTPAEPFTQGAVETGTTPLRKALIIMTDGQNTIKPVAKTGTMSANGIVHVSTVKNNVVDSTVADQLTLTACTAAKNAGIEVYTIGFGSDITPAISALLTSCASKPKFYTLASDSAGLAEAFNDIADNLLGVRLTQ
jgi:Flp pilus assembly protein TadG/predicted Fe-Mo cluster-binding NifX family protein